MFLFESGYGNLDSPTIATQAARQPVVLTQAVKHRTANSLRRIGFELRAHRRLEAADGVEQPEHSILNQIVNLDAGRQASHQMAGDALDQRNEVLDQLIPVELTSSVVHSYWSGYQA